MIFKWILCLSRYDKLIKVSIQFVRNIGLQLDRLRALIALLSIVCTIEKSSYAH